MQPFASESALDNRDVVGGLIQYDDRCAPDATSRVHNVLWFGGAVFQPDPDTPIKTRTVALEASVGMGQVLGFGAAMWVALAA
jgi:hypothetical protein